MNNIIDPGLIASIAIGYNILVHSLSTVIFKNYQFNAKLQYTSILIIIAGLVGILLSNSSENHIISNGFYFGGILLIITAVIGNWDMLNNETKLLVASALFIGVLWYSYNK